MGLQESPLVLVKILGVQLCELRLLVCDVNTVAVASFDLVPGLHANSFLGSVKSAISGSLASSDALPVWLRLSGNNMNKVSVRINLSLLSVQVDAPFISRWPCLGPYILFN